jgi:hypothetical protein
MARCTHSSVGDDGVVTGRSSSQELDIAGKSARAAAAAIISRSEPG